MSIKDSCRKAKEACLGPHLTIMLGYPWEAREDAFNAFGLARYLFEKGWADTLQATIEIPYPGARIFQECKDNDLLSTSRTSGFPVEIALHFAAEDGYASCSGRSIRLVCRDGGAEKLFNMNGCIVN